MSTSVSERRVRKEREGSNGREKKDFRVRSVVVWALVSAFCLLFSLIYQQFSHGVHSPYMTYLCMWPLVLGVIPSLLLWKLRKIPMPNVYAKYFYDSGILAMTMSSLLRGVLEIAGTASIYQVILMWIGAGLLVLGGMIYNRK